jgi:two-component sensor histidine kinase
MSEPEVLSPLDASIPADANQQLIQSLISSPTREVLLFELSNLWVRLTGASSCDILYREPGDGLSLKASTIFPELNNRLKLGRGVGLCGLVLLDNEPLFLSSGAQQHPRYARYPGMEDHEFEGIVIMPLSGGAAASFGVILLRSNGPWKLPSTTRKKLLQMADTTAYVLRGYNAAYQAGANTNRLGALSEVTKTLSASPYLEEILQLLVHLTAQQFNYKVCTVRLLDETRGELVLRATQATAKAYQRKRAIALGESIAGRAISENRPIIVRDVQTEDDYIGHDLAVEQNLRSMICVPLTLQTRPIGVLSCYTSEAREFLPDEIKALETLAKQAAVSIEHAKLQVRNTLMQEMHHRVKNNLQQIASLLRLQMHHGGYRTLTEALEDCLARILAIAAVHDLLSREDLDHVGVVSIAETLVQHQTSSFIGPNRKIKFEVRGEDVGLNMTQATQLALVLNELIQNAVEHGFQDSAEGEIHINVEQSQEQVSVWVSNSGDPLPPDFDPAIASHLGLKIVDNLARGLGGRFKLNNILGWTVAEVKFPRATGE